MPSVHFHGYVLPPPPLASISVHITPKVNWKLAETGPSGAFSVEIVNSKIHVTVEIERYSPGDKLALYMRAFDLVRTTVELVAFRKGWAVTIVISEFVDPDGVTTPIFFANDKLASFCTAFDLQSGFDEMLGIVLNDLAVYAVLNDLIASITLPHVSTVNCARAIEGIRCVIAGGGSQRKRDVPKEWIKMQKALRIDQPYREFITMHSTSPRHGRRIYTPGTITSDIVERSWKIMNRLLEYKKRGNVPLPEEFEFLKG